MPRIVPSQIVEFISGLKVPERNGVALLFQVRAAALSATIDLLDQIPDELITLDAPAYCSLIEAKAQIKDILATWKANQMAGTQLFNFQFPVTQNPLALIRDALAKCPDESPAPSTAELNFISDEELKKSLRDDMGAINRALSNGEWKAATVLAGSAIEALLLWALQQRPRQEVMAAANELQTTRTLSREPDENLERWDLHEYTRVAEKLGLIKADTATQTRLAHKFRNLIHPGRTQRLAQKCDRATALSAVSGMEHVSRDLSTH